MTTSKVDVMYLATTGASKEQAESIWSKLQAIPEGTSPADIWDELTGGVLNPSVPFPVHELLFRVVFGEWDNPQGPPPAWRPTSEQIAQSNITAFSDKTGRRSFDDLYRWSTRHRAEFWGHVIVALGIRFHKEPERVLDESGGPEAARWLPGARMNIADSCFTAPADRAAVIFQAEDAAPQTMTYGELDRLSNRVANSLRAIGIGVGDAVAIDMPMTVEAVASYLGIV